MRRCADERGAVMVLAALLLVPMLGIAAVAVDLANARQHRRGSQSAADAAALAAAQDLPDVNDAIATAKAYIADNLGLGDSAWVGCEDPEHLAVVPDTENLNECISFSSDRRQVRVRAPDRAIRTYFGNVVGKSSVEVSAAATAVAVTTRHDRIIPAAVAGVDGTGKVCVEEAGSNQPCSDREKGQFGSIASPRLNYFRTGSASGALALNYALNVDHDIVPYSAGSAVCDGAPISPCSAGNVGTGLTANHLVSSTGNNVPPVTEGYVTGGSVSTTDAGTVAFCGRLQRPDATPESLLDPVPGGCSEPGHPRTSILGRTVNGRHIYHWLTDSAKQLFYPEVWALGLDPADAAMAYTNPAYAAGDARLDCFMAGYRWNDTTATETIPDCRSVDLAFPWQETAAATLAVKDLFEVAGYSNNDGTASWAASWTELDDGTATGGKMYVSGGQLNVGVDDPSVQAGRYVSRSVDLRSGGELASSATLRVSVNTSAIKAGEVTLDVLPSGASTWTTLMIFGKNDASTLYTYDLTPYISSGTQVRFRPTKKAGGGDRLLVNDVEVSYTVEASSGEPVYQVAPILESDIVTDPRWAVVPQIAAWGTPSVAQPVQGFWAVYLGEAYTTSTKVQAFDAWSFDPALLQPGTQLEVGFSPNATTRLVG